MMFFDILFTQILRECVRIRERADKLALLLFGLINAHLHDAAYEFVYILIILVNSFVNNPALLITVDVSS